MPSRGFLNTNSKLRSWPSSLNIRLLEEYYQEIFQIFFEVVVWVSLYSPGWSS